MTQIQIPGYTIQSEIGHGGMATVYKAVQESLDRPVALKVMAPALAADPSFGERFLKEAKTVARLTHPNILAIYDIGASGHHHYMAMEYVAGGDLKARIKQGMTPDQALAVLQQVAAALDHAHRQGFVHRDIKPENILFREDGTVVLTDFGIAKALGSGTRMTQTGMSIGTPHYMSPEQARGKTVDGRSDLYSLCVVFYEMLTGRMPYNAEDTFAVALKHVNDPLPKLPVPLISYQELIDRLMAKNPEDRFADAGQLLGTIGKVQAGERVARTASATQVVASQPSNTAQSAGTVSESRRSGFLWGLGGALVAVIVGAGFYFTNQPQPSAVASGGGSSNPVMTRPIPRPVALAHQPKLQASLPPTQEKTDSSAAALARKKEIEKILSMAKKDLAAMRLTKPKGKNAYERYKAVIELDSRNDEALQGLLNIVKEYIKLNKAAKANNEYAKAENYLDKAKEVLKKVKEINSQHNDTDKSRNVLVENDIQATGGTVDKSINPSINPYRFVELSLAKDIDEGFNVAPLKNNEIPIGSYLYIYAKISGFKETKVQNGYSHDVTESIVIYDEKGKRIDKLSKRNLKREKSTFEEPNLSIKWSIKIPLQPNYSKGKYSIELSYKDNLEGKEISQSKKFAIVDGDPGPLYYENVGDKYRKQNNNDKAIENYQKAISLHNSDSSLYVKIAKCYLDLNNYVESINYLSTGIDIKGISPNDGLLYYLRAFAYKQMDENKLALVNFQKLNPELMSLSADEWHTVGHQLAELTDKKASLKAFAEAIKQEQKNGRHYGCRANIYLSIKSFDNAKYDIEKALELGLENPSALNSIAWTLATSTDSRIRDGQKAITLIEKAIRLSPENHLYYKDTAAAAYAENGNYKKAVRLQNEAISLLDTEKLRKEYFDRFSKRLKLYQHNKPYRK